MTVNYGTVTGRFTAFQSDSSDPLAIPDEIGLSGRVTLRAVPYVTRWADPPRRGFIQPVVCAVINGDLCGPESLVAGVVVVASDQPDAQPPTVIEWVASFNLDGVNPQPATVTFTVPTGGTVDLATLIE